MGVRGNRAEETERPPVSRRPFGVLLVVLDSGRRISRPPEAVLGIDDHRDGGVPAGAGAGIGHGPRVGGLPETGAEARLTGSRHARCVGEGGALHRSGLRGVGGRVLRGRYQDAVPALRAFIGTFRREGVNFFSAIFRVRRLATSIGGVPGARAGRLRSRPCLTLPPSIWCPSPPVCAPSRTSAGCVSATSTGTAASDSTPSPVTCRTWPVTTPPTPAWRGRAP